MIIWEYLPNGLRKVIARSVAILKRNNDRDCKNSERCKNNKCWIWRCGPLLTAPICAWKHTLRPLNCKTENGKQLARELSHQNLYVGKLIDPGDSESGPKPEIPRVTAMTRVAAWCIHSLGQKHTKAITKNKESLLLVRIGCQTSRKLHQCCDRKPSMLSPWSFYAWRIQWGPSWGENKDMWNVIVHELTCVSG